VGGVVQIISGGAAPNASISSLHQLPSPPADFTGREEDLSVLRSRLTKGGSVAIFGLRGMGGIGKTALALKLAEELTPAYPDAQLYLDLKGVDLQPLTAAQAMAFVLRSFHPEARLPESEADLAGLYRSVLHGKRVLLLMDNTASRDQVEPLIPPAGSLLLVTSRFHFTVPGLFARDLDEMSAEDARNLLLSISSRIDSDADAIANLCGRLPLALRFASGALAERPDLSPTEYARRLEEGKERLGPVDASLSLSYELLSENQRRLWCLLAVFPGTFDAPAAATVWELEADPTSEALGELVRTSLVEWEENERRYRLHDLARSFADQQIEKTEREVVQRRHAEHYLKILWTADRLYEEGGVSLGQALRLFDTEWGNIQAGFAWASGHSHDDEAGARICDDYPNAGAFCLALRQHPREQIRWREFALVAARQRKNRAGESVHLASLGFAYVNLGEARRAIEFYEQCLAIARDVSDRKREGQVLGNLGIAYANLGETGRAIELYEQRLAIARDIGDRQGESRACGSLGNAYVHLGETRRAIELYEQWLAIAREIGDRLGEGSALGGLGNAYKDLGETRRAIELYEQQLAIARDIGDRQGEANASWNLGLVIEKEGDLARAADLMQVRVTYLTELGHPDAEKAAADVAALRARIAEEGP
jgi:tetratricopeptide (TPR) repeat protein